MSGSHEALSDSPYDSPMMRELVPSPLLEREVEPDAESEGSSSALAPMVPSLAALSLAAVAFKLGFAETASLTKRVMAEESNSDNQEVEIFLCWPLDAAFHDPGVETFADVTLVVFTCFAHPARLMMPREMKLTRMRMLNNSMVVFYLWRDIFKRRFMWIRVLWVVFHFIVHFIF